MTDRLASLSLSLVLPRPVVAAAPLPKAGTSGGGSFSQMLQQAGGHPSPTTRPAPAPVPSPPPEHPAKAQGSAEGMDAEGSPLHMGDTSPPQAVREEDEDDEKNATPSPQEMPPGILPDRPPAIPIAPREADGGDRAGDASRFEGREQPRVKRVPDDAGALAESFAVQGLPEARPGLDSEAALLFDASLAGLAAGAGTGTEASLERDGSMPHSGHPASPAVFPTLLQPVATSGVANGTPLSAPLAAEARIDAPLDSPEFGAALASQVSYLVREGVQQARLQLNPAEMGPVTVQIALQGTQAQVDFAAASAATRAALEDSLAQLAASLQGAGLTLTGGGVSQQAPPPRDAAPQRRGATTGRLAATEDSPGRAEAGGLQPPGRMTAGRLDVYA